MTIGLAGAGSMAQAMARGWARSVDPPSMRFCDLDRGRAEAIAAEVGGATDPDLATLSEHSDVVVLAVKPDALEPAAAELSAAPAVLSVLAVTPLARLSEALDAQTIVRAMPSQPAQVGQGVTCYSIADGAVQAQAAHIVALLERLGPAFAMPEDQIDAAMAIMSCAPAYVAKLAEALASSGQREGLAPELSARLVTETIAGTGALLRERGASEVINAVAPPGGATEAGLEALERHDFAAAVAAAVEASLERFR